MHKKIGSWAILLVFIAGCSLGKPGSGTSKTETRQTDDFSRVSLQCSGNVDIQVGGPKSVTVSLDDNLIDMVRTEVKDGKLIIRSTGRYSSSIGLQVDVVVPELDGFYCSGSGDANIKDIDSKWFEAHVSGSGGIRASGIAETVNVQISGSGEIDLTNLSSATADVAISGSGDVQVTSTRRVTANISGSGDVKIHGDPPEVVEAISGSGDVEKVKSN